MPFVNEGLAGGTLAKFAGRVKRFLWGYHGKLAGATGRSPLQGFWTPGQARNDAQAVPLDPFALTLFGVIRFKPAERYMVLQ